MSIKTCIRIRPLLDHEHPSQATTQAVAQKVVVSDKVDTVEIRPDKADEQIELLTFDAVFGPNSKQEEVFQSIGKPLVDDAFQGFNSTIFAYGQTGAGKTYTVMGPNGIVHRFTEELYKRIASEENKKSELFPIKYKVELSMYEIHQEVVFDLLNETRQRDSLKVREHMIDGPYVEGLTILNPTSASQAEESIKKGITHRVTTSTKTNNQSSRSHAVITFKLIKMEILDEKTGFHSNNTAIINIVDLAGSETVGQSGAAGKAFKEGAMINNSLTVLGRIINQLADMEDNKQTENEARQLKRRVSGVGLVTPPAKRSVSQSSGVTAIPSKSASNTPTRLRTPKRATVMHKNTTPVRRGTPSSKRTPVRNATPRTPVSGRKRASLSNKAQPHIPYRDSVLTFLLRESLGGNAKSTLLGNVSATPFPKGDDSTTEKTGAKALRNVTVRTPRATRRSRARAAARGQPVAVVPAVKKSAAAAAAAEVSAAEVARNNITAAVKTLQYVQRARSIRTRAAATNADPRAELIKAIKQESVEWKRKFEELVAASQTPVTSPNAKRPRLDKENAGALSPASKKRLAGDVKPRSPLSSRNAGVAQVAALINAALSTDVAPLDSPHKLAKAVSKAVQQRQSSALSAKLGDAQKEFDAKLEQVSREAKQQLVQVQKERDTLKTDNEDLRKQLFHTCMLAIKLDRFSRDNQNVNFDSEEWFAELTAAQVPPQQWQAWMLNRIAAIDQKNMELQKAERAAAEKERKAKRSIFDRAFGGNF